MGVMSILAETPDSPFDMRDGAIAMCGVWMVSPIARLVGVPRSIPLPIGIAEMGGASSL